MNSGKCHQSKPAGTAVGDGGAQLLGAVLRIKPGDTYAITSTPEGVEITLSATTVAELRASLKCPAPFREYNTVAEEAKRHKLSEKTIRNLLKEKHAPHYGIGSDTRIDPVAMDKWMEKNYALGGAGENASHTYKK